jgi:hypothetical protein
MFPESTVRLSNLGHPRFFGGGLEVEVVAGDEGFLFEGLADAGGGFGVGGSGQGAAQELERVEVVGTLFDGDGFGVGWGLDPCVDDLSEGGFALLFGVGQAVFGDGSERAIEGRVFDVVDDGSCRLRVGGCRLGGRGCRGGSPTHGGAMNGPTGSRVGWEVAGGDLEAEEHMTGALGVDAVGAEGAEDQANAGLDGGAVLGHGEEEFGVERASEFDFRVGGRSGWIGARGGAVVVAEGAVAAEGGGAATVAVVEDVAAGEAFGSGGLGAGGWLSVHVVPPGALRVDGLNAKPRQFGRGGRNT